MCFWYTLYTRLLKKEHTHLLSHLSVQLVGVLNLPVVLWLVHCGRGDVVRQLVLIDWQFVLLRNVVVQWRCVCNRNEYWWWLRKKRNVLIRYSNQDFLMCLRLRLNLNIRKNFNCLASMVNAILILWLARCLYDKKKLQYINQVIAEEITRKRLFWFFI